nr:unnamed protein product [Callosobruchus analis]
MLFIFHVDSGRMMTFDMSLALESVSNLKVHVQNECQIAADKQVLLISGGECLDPNKRVCSYSAGTDTNPIFLFSKQLIESPTPPSPCVDQGIDPAGEACPRPSGHAGDVADGGEAHSACSATARTRRTLLRACERLVHDQHLQQQGWSAVVANLEDITVEFRKRAEVFELGFAEFMGEREAYLSFLKYFHSDLDVLQRIPVLSVLLELDKQNLEGSKTSEENLNTDEVSASKEMTLFEWISTADSKNTMDQLYEHCAKGLETFNGKAFETLKSEIAAILLESDNNKMKEVKGLGERLFGLENLIVQVKKLVKHQGELAQSFLNNQSRASNTKDPSVLPDLCMSHKQQLQMMAQHHRDLAKEELSVNLYHRLRWVMYVEDKILEIDHKLVIYYESLKRLRRHLEVLQQIHLAPATYLSAIAEVVRRRAFSQSFLLWASEVACHLLTIHNEEVTRRKEFQSQFDGHFLNALFPGMDDLPPSFATQAPSMFDTALPKITQEDIDRLKKGNPDVAVEDKLVRAVDAVGLGSQLDRQLLFKESAAVVPHLKDLERGCESETDTEEFEKVGQSPLELHFDKNLPSPRCVSSSRPGPAQHQDASTLTEDNLQISRSEHEKLKSCLLKMQSLAKEATTQLKSELADLKNRIMSDIVIVNEGFFNTGTGFKHKVLEYDSRNIEILENVRKEQSVVVQELKEKEDGSAKEISELKKRKHSLQCRVEDGDRTICELKEAIDVVKQEFEAKIESLEKQLLEKEVEKEKMVREVTDRLNREHKAEIENIRSRFKLMTMERSPSDTSLEKSGEFSSLSSHTTLLAQMAENFELDKEKAINEALKEEREKWEKVIAARVKEMERKFEEEKDILLKDLARKVSEEKEKQIDVLRERERDLTLECWKYKTTSKVDVQTSPIRQCLPSTSSASSSGIGKEMFTSSTSSSSSRSVSRLNIDQCRVGDLVVVVWDPSHQSFRIAQENKQMYFLHTESLEALGLAVVDGRPNKAYCVGESENRYKLPKGTKFFRLKVRPVSLSGSFSKEVVTQSLYHPRPPMSETSRTMSQSTISEVMEGAPQSLPTSPIARDHPVIPEKEEVDCGARKSESGSAEGDTEGSKHMEVGSWGSEGIEVHKEAHITPHVEVICPTDAENHFAEDSGIVENAEEGVALDETVVSEEACAEEGQRDPLNYERNVDEQHGYVSTTWLEMMFSRMFSNSVQNVD